MAGHSFTTAVIAPDTNSNHGFQGTEFTGTFDGNDHLICNLTIDTNGLGNDYLGLFGKTDSSEIKNLSIENVNVTGGNNSGILGGLVGLNKYGGIRNCYATGAVTGGDESMCLGGLAGDNFFGTISDCYTKSAVASGDDSSALGGLVGHNGGTNAISNCCATGTVIGGDDSYFLGGLVGLNRSSTYVFHCYSSSSVTGGFKSSDVGGLVGGNKGAIICCSASGVVNGYYSVGGLVGGSIRTISNCYSTGAVNGYSGIGGLVAGNDGTISNSYSTGAVTGFNSSDIGGLVGNNSDTISHCFWDTDTSGTTNGVGNMDPDPNGAMGRTTTQMQTQSTFTDYGWDFMGETANGTEDIWYMPLYSGYPILNWQCKYSGGTGIETDPWQIAEPNDLLYLSNHPNDYNSHFILTADINLAGCDFNTAVIAPDTNSSFSGFQGTEFTGTFDGNDHIIHNLTIDTNDLGNDYLGLFGCTGSSSKIKNLGIEDVNIASGDNSRYLGGLAGCNNEGIIINCYMSGEVTSEDGSAGIGGIVGYNAYGSISNCYANSTVTGGSPLHGLGGLVGANDDKISNCYAKGSVTGGDESRSLGGLVGCNLSFDATVINCYTSVSVTGGDYSEYLGGLIGQNNGTVKNCDACGSVAADRYSDSLGGLVGKNLDEIRNCYATGVVIGGGYSQHLGGLVGCNGPEHSNISNCYAKGSVTIGGHSDNIGGLVGRNHRGEISICYANGDVSGGDKLHNAGGLIGFNDGEIRSCYATGAVTGGDDSCCFGGLLGVNSDYIDRCFWDTQTSDMNEGVGCNDGGTITNLLGKTTAQMQTQSTFTDYGWDFMDETVNGVFDHWKIRDGFDYPRLRRQIDGDIAGLYGVNFVDFAMMANAWRSTPALDNWNSICDLHKNGAIDWLDLQILFENWLKRYNPADIAGSYGVDFVDFAVIANTWQSTRFDDNWNVLCNLYPDYVIDWLDLQILTENWLNGL